MPKIPVKKRELENKSNFVSDRILKKPRVEKYAFEHKDDKNEKNDYYEER